MYIENKLYDIVWMFTILYYMYICTYVYEQNVQIYSHKIINIIIIILEIIG